MLDGASSYNTINGHIKNASKKLNAAGLVFDNSRNKALDDEELAKLVRRSRAFRRGRIYMLTKDEDLVYIR